MSEPIIIVDNVHKSYLMGKEAVPALRGVSLEIQRGEFVCLMGPSGSGKTTLLNVVGGLDEPSRGHLIVDGQNLVSLNENELARLRLEKMGFIFQNYNLLANFTALENVEAPMVLANVPRKERQERAHKLLDRVGLGDRTHHYPSELSGGQQQRVFIARALAQEAELLLLDEPLNGLDLPSQQAIFDILDGLRPDGVTVLVATHDLQLAADRFDKIMLLNRRVVAFARPTAVLTPDNLLQAYGGHVHVLPGAEQGILVDDCCGHDEYDVISEK